MDGGGSPPGDAAGSHDAGGAEDATSAEDAGGGGPDAGVAGHLTLVAYTQTPTATWDLDTWIRLEAQLVARDDASHRTVTDDVQWVVEPAGNGVVRAGGFLEALAAGDLSVRARYMGLESNAVTLPFAEHSPRRIRRLDVTPPSAIVEIGTAVTLQAVATRGDKTTSDLTRDVRWTLSASTATITVDRARGVARFSSAGPGLWYATATSSNAQSNHVAILVTARGSADVARATIGPSGGTVALGGMSVVVPAGAFAGATTIAVARVDSALTRRTRAFDAVGSAYLIDAGDAVPMRPVQVHLPVPAGSVAAEDELYFGVDHGEGWVIADATVENGVARHVQDRFSIEQLLKIRPLPVGSRAAIDGVPFYPQNNGNWCFVTTTAMMLTYYGRDERRWTLAAKLGLGPNDAIPAYRDTLEPFGFTTDDDWFATWRGFASFVRRNLQAGRPVLVASPRIAHAFVIVGYEGPVDFYVHDTGGGSLGFASPSAYARVSATTMKNALDPSLFGGFVYATVVLDAAATPRVTSSDLVSLDAASSDWDTVLELGGHKNRLGYFHQGRGNAVRADQPEIGFAYMSGGLRFSLVTTAVSVNAPEDIPVRFRIRTRGATEDAYDRTFMERSRRIGTPLETTFRLDPVADQQGFRHDAEYTVEVTSGVEPVVDRFSFRMHYKPTITFRGVVMKRDARGALQPVPNATVEISGTVDRHGQPIRLTTNAQGRFTASHVFVPFSVRDVFTFWASDGMDSGSLEVSRGDVYIGENKDVGMIAIEPPGPPGRFALDYDGAGAFTVMGTLASGGRQLSGTIEAWIKPTSYREGGIIDLDSCGGNYLQLQPSGHIASGFWECFTATPSSTVVSTSTVPLGRWTHVARAWTASSHTIYINGAPVASAAMDSNAINQGGLLMHVGHRHSNGRDLNRYFDGEIDEVRVWSVARSAAQIRASMRTTIPASAGLIGSWPFEEGNGTSSADTSGGGHGASIQGARWQSR